MNFICVTESEHLHMFKRFQRYQTYSCTKDKVVISCGVFNLEVKHIGNGVWKNEKEDVTFVEASNIW